MKQFFILLILFLHISIVAAQVECTLAEAIMLDGYTLIPADGAVLEDVTPNVPDVILTVTANARVRSEPVAVGDANVVNGVDAGVTLNALARNAAGDWFYIYLGDQASGRAEAGWISNQVLRVAGDISILPVVAAGDNVEPPLQPMSLWTLESVGSDNCGVVLMQSNESDNTSALIFNDIEVIVVGTAVLQPLNEGVEITLLEGQAVVRNGISQALLVPGTATIAFADTELTTQSAAHEVLAMGVLMSEYAEEDQVVTGVAAVEPPPADEIEDLIREHFAPNGAFDGQYFFSRTIYCTIPERAPTTHYYEGYTRLNILADSISGQHMEAHIRGADGRFYWNTVNKYPASIKRDGGQTIREETVESIITILSETSIYRHIHNAIKEPLHADGYATGEYGEGRCIWETNLTWVSP